MKISNFVNVGENIHCTRIYKVGGKLVDRNAAGKYVVSYEFDGKARELSIPENFTQNADWESEKVKHCAVAIWQGNYGSGADKAEGVTYIQSLAKKQEKLGATYLDINVDEFSTDVDERAKLMKWTVDVVQKASSLPVSVDSSNATIMRAGLGACDKSRGRPMINSVSLERAELIDVAAEFDAVIIASAAGEKDLPCNTEQRLANIERLVEKLEKAAIRGGRIHFDPLVFPISVDGNNGKGFLEAVSAIRKKYGKEIHIVAGLSNVSFGMPNRKLINQVFTYLAVEAGADGGIVDPQQINVKILNSMDPASESFKLARDLLMGEDEFGMNFITACREGSV